MSLSSEILIISFALLVLMLLPQPVFKRSLRKEVEKTGDQRCPHCKTWQSDCGGWSAVLASVTPEINFFAECGNCGSYSKWVWIGPGVCMTYEEINKQKPTPPGDE